MHSVVTDRVEQRRKADAAQALGFAADTRSNPANANRYRLAMETDDDLFLEMVEGVTLTVLTRIGDDPKARYRFFRRFVELARDGAPGPKGDRTISCSH
jgi:hypothetical protein